MIEKKKAEIAVEALLDGIVSFRLTMQYIKETDTELYQYICENAPITDTNLRNIKEVNTHLMELLKKL